MPFEEGLYAGVSNLRQFIRDNQGFRATNSGPLSETKVRGTPNRLNISNKQRCTVAVDLSVHCTASIQEGHESTTMRMLPKAEC